MQELQITADERPQVRVLRLAGQLDLNTRPQFEAAVRKLDRDKSLIVNLEQVPYMDSSGLGAVLSAYLAAQKHGQKFALTNVPPRVLTIMQLARVASVVPLFETVEAAEQKLAV